MANTTIQIRRSNNTANATSLVFGEFAYTNNGSILWIGNATASIAIAGVRSPGTATANQALVFNANNWINQVASAKLIIGTDGSATQNITSISYFANSTQLGATASASNNEMVPSWAIKTYVDGKVAGSAGAPTGSNTQVQFNDSGSFGGSAGLTFDKTTNTLTIANTLSVTNYTGVTQNFNGTTLNLNGNVVVTDTSFAVTSNTQTYKANSTVSGLQITGNSTVTYILLGDATSTTNVNATTANYNGTTQNINGTTLNLNANVAVIDTTFAVTSNTQTYKANSTVTGMAITGNSTVTEIRVGSGASVTNVVSTNTNITSTNTTISGAFNQSGGVATFSSNTTFNGANVLLSATNNAVSGVFNQTGGVVNIAGNTTFSGSNLLSTATNTAISGAFNQSGGVVLIAGNTTHSGANTTINSTNTTIASNVTITGTTHSVTGVVTFNNDVTVTGNLNVTGTATTINVATVTVQDPIIKLASNNTTSNTVDIGIYGVFGNSTVTSYTGLFRDTSNNGIFTLFTGTTVEPTTTVDTSQGSYVRAALLADFTTEVFTANSTKVNITAGSMNTKLTVQDGGTGVGTFTANGILYGNGTGNIQVTAAGTDGQVLQFQNAAVVLGMLDGGTF